MTIAAKSSLTTYFPRDTHSKCVGYILWIFGFMGAHRFYYDRPRTGTLYLLTFGLLGLGWLLDLFFIHKMDEECDIRYSDGQVNYSIAWILLGYFGVLGVHRLYMGKYLSGIIYFLTCGFFLFGLIYDYWTLNDQINEIQNQETILVRHR
jgi:TM2 domain-containing membrane protein YozV